MPNLEYSVLHHLLTPYMNLDLNTSSGLRYLVEPENYKLVPSLRVTQDNISMADGSVLHPRWKTGIVAMLRIGYWVTPSDGSPDAPACGSDLRVMHEQLVGAVNSITRLTGEPQRLEWQPTGYGDLRMLDQIQLLSWPDPSYDLDGDFAYVDVAFETPFPYAIDATETTTPVVSGSASGAGAVLTNAGNCPFSPVIVVNGPFTAFTITNLSDLDDQGNPLEVVYDSTRPGALSVAGGHTAEIDFFRGTIYKDGDGANLIAGIDPTMTDFFHLQPGDNHIEITGADCDVLWNNAWA